MISEFMLDIQVEQGLTAHPHDIDKYWHIQIGCDLFPPVCAEGKLVEDCLAAAVVTPWFRETAQRKAGSDQDSVIEWRILYFIIFALFTNPVIKNTPGLEVWAQKHYQICSLFIVDYFMQLRRSGSQVHYFKMLNDYSQGAATSSAI